MFFWLATWLKILRLITVEFLSEFFWLFLMRSIFVTALLLSSLASSPAYAQDVENNISQLMQMDIEELFQVSVASKKNEPLKQAPSVVSIVTQKEIQQYGAKNLTDIFNW